MTADTILVNKAFVGYAGMKMVLHTSAATAGRGINAAAINLNAMPPSFARCVLCRAKILRLKQHHKGQRHPREKASSQEATSSSALSESETQGGVPQSVSNYSITRLSSSSSNHSFASGNITTSRILSL